MATATPARIKYKLDSADGTEIEKDIRFHTVLFEDHEATSEVTKFPVQTGFEVSNHAIRKNRRVTISAVITNTLLKGAKTAYKYSSNNSKTIFADLKDLVNNKVKCDVTTNLGIYTPVIFTKFTTKQVAGMVDAIQIMISGEELQVSDAANGTTPAVVNFLEVSEEKRESLAIEVRAAGIDVSDTAKLSSAVVNLGSDFSIANLTTTLEAVSTTYLCTGLDPVTGGYSYEVHTTDINLFPPTLDELVGSDTNDLSDLIAGVSEVGNCIANGSKNIIIKAASKEITTAMGELKKSIYGAYYGTMNMVDSEVGQALIGMTTGCVIRGVTQYDETISYKPGESLPTADQILNGARKLGKKALDNANITASGIPTVEAIFTLIEN